MRKYVCLNRQIYRDNNYSITPLRDEDKFLLLKWRNEQIYHLRQKEKLTEEKQISYFGKIISKLFDCDQPDQILFSFLKEENCIGYGGLVHINWADKNAEISFLMDTTLENDYFEYYWETFLNLIQEVAFKDLKFHKIFTYAFDVRPRLYNALEKSGFELEGILKGQCFFNGEYFDVKIHGKLNQGDSISVRNANSNDLEITYKWATDPVVRNNSFNSRPILKEEHVSWFNRSIADENCKLFIFEDDKKAPIGLVRINIQDIAAIIGITLDENFRGKGLSSQLIEKAISKLESFEGNIEAYIKTENVASINAFKAAGFKFSKEIDMNGENSFLYIKSQYAN